MSGVKEVTKNAVDLTGYTTSSVLLVDPIGCVAYAPSLLHQESC